MSKLVGPPEPRAAAQPPPQPPAAYGAAAMTDLESLIQWSSSEVLNAASKKGIDTILKQGLRDQNEMTISSDADEELLLNITFQEMVKVHSISVMAPGDGTAPKTLKFFVNKNGMDFDSARDGAASQELELSAEQIGERIQLHFVKFQAVTTLSIFIACNQDDGECTTLSGIKLWGAPCGATNMKEFKRVTGEKGEGE